MTAPHSQRAPAMLTEEHLVGALLRDPDRWLAAKAELDDPSRFEDAACALLYECILDRGDLATVESIETLASNRARLRHLPPGAVGLSRIKALARDACGTDVAELARRVEFGFGCVCAEPKAAAPAASGAKVFHLPSAKANQVSAEEPPRAVPAIEVGPDEMRVADEAIAALAAGAPDVYQRAARLVRVARDDENTPHIDSLPEPSLREALAAAALWQQRNRKGELVHVHPPAFVVKAVAARGTWPGVRVLRAVVESPVLRPDGTVVSAPGYDPATRVYYAPSTPVGAVADRPSLEDARRALAELREVFADFPYERPAHEAAMLATVLTPFARYAFDGYVPLVTFDGNLRGVGKSMQADAVSVIYTGRTMPRRAYVPDEAEMKKTVTSIAAGGSWGVLFDNVADSLGGAALDMALTGERIEDRLFGRNDVTLRFKLSTIWMASGNNLALHGDLVRRVLPVRLCFNGERPEERTEFKHPDLLAWAREHRGRLAAAALTILRAWFVAGRPRPGIRPWGSYDAWSGVVRNALVWCGMPDPRDACVDLPDTAGDLTSQLVAGWAEAFPGGESATVAEAVKRLVVHPARFDTLRAALTELGGKAPDKADPVSLGKRLAKYRDRVIGGRRLRKLPKEDRGTPWRVERMGPADGPDDPDGSHSARGTDFGDEWDVDRAGRPSAPSAPSGDPSEDPEREAIQAADGCSP